MSDSSIGITTGSAACTGWASASAASRVRRGGRKNIRRNIRIEWSGVKGNLRRSGAGIPIPNGIRLQTLSFCR